MQLLQQCDTICEAITKNKVGRHRQAAAFGATCPLGAFFAPLVYRVQILAALVDKVQVFAPLVLLLEK